MNPTFPSPALAKFVGKEADESVEHHPRRPMNDREFVRHFLISLRNGEAPWRFPYNRQPEFVPYFGMFFTGEPRSMADSDYSAVDSIIKAVGVRLRHHWNCNKPRYYRSDDRIVLPLRSYFQDEANYHSTRLHEVLHAIEHRAGWTGPGHQAELVAEAGTAMILSQLQLAHDSDNTNNNKWVAWWTMETTSDPAYLFDSLAQAAKSARYLLDLRRRNEAT